MYSLNKRKERKKTWLLKKEKHVPAQKKSQ